MHLSLIIQIVTNQRERIKQLRYQSSNEAVHKYAAT